MQWSAYLAETPSTQFGNKPAVLATGLLAVILHAAFLVHISFEVDDHGAKDFGSKGVSIGIKRLPMPLATVAALPVAQANPVPKPELKPVSSPKPKAVEKPPKSAVSKAVPATPRPAKPRALASPRAVAQVNRQQTEASLGEHTAEQNTAQSAEQTEMTPAAVAGGGDPNVRIQYVRELAAWLEQHKRYPNAARRRGQEGRVLLEFSMAQNGALEQYQIIHSTPYPLLNKAVEKMITMSNPLPAVPTSVMGDRQRITFTVPVSFTLSR